MNEAKFFTKLFEEASELFVSKNWEKWSEKCVENVTLRGITPTLRPISRMAPDMVNQEVVIGVLRHAEPKLSLGFV